MTVIGTLFKRVKDVHFVGVGGVGMSGIAEILLALGFRVSGSDLKASVTTERLQGLGARIFVGHDEHHLDKADVVVFSSAVDPENPEVKAAVRRMIPVIPRAEMLAELMRMHTSIAVAGMHGKTTTTSMIAWILSQAGLDPTVVIGGKLDHLGGGARLGEGDLLVAEADESDKSFLKLYPAVAIVTNMDMEHLDCYKGMDEIRGAFLEFINKLPFYGFAVVCLDDPELRMIIPEIRKRFITYGFSPQAMFHGRKLSFEGGLSCCEVYKDKQLLGELRLNMPGTHNLQNALGAVAVSDVFDVPFEAAQKALSTFPGVQRRFTLRGEAAGVTVIDDYGHHPAEIRAVIQAARQIAPSRIAILFQPHRYSRTKALFDDFTTCFHDSDLLYVTDIYAASEKPVEGVSGKALAEAIYKRGHKTVKYLGDRGQLVSEVVEDLKEGDMLITLGAGDVTHLGPAILAALKHKENRTS
jgi:UDP-N-acetylmuramate--alanine ligase